MTDFINKAYFLPDDWTFRDLYNARKAWNISPSHTVLTAVYGVCAAWGKPLANDYKLVSDYIMEQLAKADNGLPHHLGQ